MSFVLNRFVDALSKFNQRDDSDEEWPVSLNAQAAAKINLESKFCVANEK